jgi:hypothetical protein
MFTNGEEAVIWIPYSAAFFEASARSAAWRMIFDGMQPWARQVPPGSFLSISVTSAPSWPARRAAVYPPGPEPIIASFTSCLR